MSTKIIVILMILAVSAKPKIIQKDINARIGINYIGIPNYLQPEIGLELSHRYQKHISLSYEIVYSAEQIKYDNAISDIYNENGTYFEEKQNGTEFVNGIGLYFIPVIHPGKRFFVGYGIGVKSVIAILHMDIVTYNIKSNETETNEKEGIEFRTLALRGLLKFGWDFDRYALWINGAGHSKGRVGINFTYKISSKNVQ